MKTKPISEMNFVPYIDVMLVLLIIFMITTPIKYMKTNVNVPSLSADKIDVTNKEEMYIVSLDINNNLSLNNEIKNIDEIVEIIKDKNRIYLAADENVTYKSLSQVMSKLRENNITNINLMFQN